MRKILIVGAGFSGAVIAKELAAAGYVVDVIDSREHAAGNCHTERDETTGIMVHRHGPHIFHTDNEVVWDYVRQFDEFMPYICQVKATTGGRVYSLPINLLTINQFFDRTMSPKEASDFLRSISAKDIDVPVSFEEQALKFLGEELYTAFFKGYPIKQWGIHPSELPASILKRLPVRFDYNDNYFNHKFQGIPQNGYTYLIGNILKQDGIALKLGVEFSERMRVDYEHVFFSGPLDGWFDYRLGSLGYRTLSFENSIHQGDYQGCAVMSYPEEVVPYTRITEHKYFTPWEKHEQTIVSKEFSRLCALGDTPYYPIRLVKEKTLLAQYVQLAHEEKNVTFIGRLGTYRYLDMDVTISEALSTASGFIKLSKEKQEIPSFFNSPLSL